MADVYAIFGTLLALGIAFPGMLTAFWLLFPRRVEIARDRVAQTPWKTLGLGVGGAFLTAVPLIVLFSISIPVSNFLAATLMFLALTFAGLGAAGVAAHMGGYLKERAREGLSPLGAFVRGAVALELAAAFPIIGWFIFIPASLLTSYGAAIFALLRWSPKPKREKASVEAVPAGVEA